MRMRRRRGGWRWSCGGLKRTLPLTLQSRVAVVHLRHPALACDQLLQCMSHVKRHTSHVTRHTSPAAASTRTSCARACRTLHRPAAQLGWLGMLRTGVTLKGGSSKSHVTRHTSHVTRHTSHVTRHTSHVTSSTSPSMNVCSPSMASSCTRSSSILSPRALQNVTVFLCGKRN